MIGIIVNNMEQYKREPKFSEFIYLQEFSNVLQTLLDDTRVLLKSGETASISTQRMQVINNGETAYGKRIDVLVACNLETYTDDVEICSIEFKKANVSTNILRQQQNKNLRISACILNDIHLLTGNIDHQLVYFDFAGKSAYMVQLYKHENCFVGHKIGSFSLIGSLVELKQLRNSVETLYTWKEVVVNLSNTIALSHVDQSYKYDLIEISDYAQVSPSGSPKRKVEPVIICLSPSNQ
ncbi:hypothetical protein BY458DRAFT_557384 [Sporodiniella umbellata]|nr:hypothetical protein BY458DRAFT_557384 [Sporodiniella umbellata]